ncbi:DNSL3 Deoxyribonuclease, partial [Polypterus senegalus]
MKIASFNVQRFGVNKISNPDILPVLIKIVSRYDIILILEVVDIKNTAVKDFVKKLNKHDTVKLIDTYQYEDNQVGDEDAFAREPYVLRFACENTKLKDLVLIPVHTMPEDSFKEIDELYDVVIAVKDKWKTENIMILGDFNADGAYLSNRKMKKIRIRTDPIFKWLIADDVDTTANTGNDYTYDRIVVYGDEMLKGIVPKSAKPFNFQVEYGLTEEQALRISDHYPVEVELKSANYKDTAEKDTHSSVSPEKKPEKTKRKK